MERSRRYLQAIDQAELRFQEDYNEEVYLPERLFSIGFIEGVEWADNTMFTKVKRKLSSLERKGERVLSDQEIDKVVKDIKTIWYSTY